MCSAQESNELLIYRRIISGMSEGVLTLNNSGKITYLNAAAVKILGMGREIIGKPFAAVFFTRKENDGFNQAVLDAIYENSVTHNTPVDFFDGERMKKLFVSTSFLTAGEEKVGVTAVMSDITELAELQDAVKATARIKGLNRDLKRRNEFIKKIFGRYLSDEIVNSILEGREGLAIGGRKQEVTIMFTDLRGFTAISERTEPDKLISMLNFYLSKMIEIILSRRGTILEFIGDAIVVVFGAPLESESKDRDAVCCAIEMQCSMAEINEYNLRMGWPEIEMGIGIHTGEVVLGNIGSEKKTKYDIIGKNVNLASRIESYTVGGQILVSEVTRANIGADLITRSEREILPKGVSTAVRVYDVKALEGREMPDTEQEFKAPEKPLKLSFFVVNGKHVDSEERQAEIVGLSHKQARLKTEKPLAIGTNIKFISQGDEIFAKVLGTGDIVTVHFTMGKIK